MVAKAAKIKIKNGEAFDVVFYANPRKESAYRFRATHIGEHRAPKVILCDDGRIQPRKLTKVRVVSVKKPASRDRGFIEVEYLSQVRFALDDGIYVDRGDQQRGTVEQTRDPRVFRAALDGLASVCDDRAEAHVDGAVRLLATTGDETLPTASTCRMWGRTWRWPALGPC